jgi:large subunit ribosomal protein L20
MARVKRGTKRRARRKKYLKRTKGFFLTKSKLYQSAQEAANRADRYAFRDRRAKKRQYRRLWIQRVGAAARLNGITYGQLIHGLKAAGVELDRKVLADIAVKDAAGFAQIAEKAKAFAPKPSAKKAGPARHPSSVEAQTSFVIPSGARNLSWSSSPASFSPQLPRGAGCA